MQILLKIALVSILHDKIELVSICNKRVNISANVTMSHLAHSLFFLQSNLQWWRIFKYDLFHHINIVVNYKWNVTVVINWSLRHTTSLLTTTYSEIVLDRWFQSHLVQPCSKWHTGPQCLHQNCRLWKNLKCCESFKIDTDSKAHVKWQTKHLYHWFAAKQLGLFWATLLVPKIL